MISSFYWFSQDAGIVYLHALIEPELVAVQRWKDIQKEGSNKTRKGMMAIIKNCLFLYRAYSSLFHCRSSHMIRISNMPSCGYIAVILLYIDMAIGKSVISLSYSSYGEHKYYSLLVSSSDDSLFVSNQILLLSAVISIFSINTRAFMDAIQLINWQRR